MPRFGTLDTQFLDDSGDPLVSGLIYFYEPGTTTLKNTYSDINLTTANSNPVELTASGRLNHDVYYSGSIDAKLCTSAGVQVKSISSLSASDGAVFDTYSSALTYGSGDIITYNSKYYKSLSASNSSNTPSSTPTKWEEIKFVGVWNTNVSYVVDDIVFRNGTLYTCVTANSGTDPDTDDGSNWQASAYSTGTVVLSADSSKYTTPEWLPCDGSAFNATTYAGLAAKLKQWPVKLTDPATMPTGTGNGCDFSPSDTYLAVAHSTSPYVTIYSRSSDTFTKLSDPATLPTGTGHGASFSYDGNFLAVGHTTTPFITIYEITAGPTFTKVSNPATLPPNAGYDCAFDPTNTYLAVAHPNSPYLSIYTWSGTTFTKTSNPATLPTGTGRGVCWDSTGRFLAVAHDTSPYITIYEEDAGTFTKLSDPVDLPASNAYHVAFDSTDTYLAVAHNNESAFTLYKRSDTTFTKVAEPEITASGSGRGAAFTDDGLLFISKNNVAPTLQGVTYDNDVLVEINKQIDSPASQGEKIAVSRTGAYLAEPSGTSTQRVAIFKFSDITPHINSDGHGSVKAYIKTGL